MAARFLKRPWRPIMEDKTACETSTAPIAEQVVDCLLEACALGYPAARERFCRGAVRPDRRGDARQQATYWFLHRLIHATDKATPLDDFLLGELQRLGTVARDFLRTLTSAPERAWGPADYPDNLPRYPRIAGRLHDGEITLTNSFDYVRGLMAGAAGPRHKAQRDRLHCIFAALYTPHSVQRGLKHHWQPPTAAMQPLLSELEAMADDDVAQDRRIAAELECLWREGCDFGQSLGRHCETVFFVACASKRRNLRTITFFLETAGVSDAELHQCETTIEASYSPWLSNPEVLQQLRLAREGRERRWSPARAAWVAAVVRR